MKKEIRNLGFKNEEGRTFIPEYAASFVRHQTLLHKRSKELSLPSCVEPDRSGVL